MQTQIIAIGNSFGLRLPKPVLDALQLEKTSHVSIQLRKDSIVMRPAPKPMNKNPRAGWFDQPTVANQRLTKEDTKLDSDWQKLDFTNDAQLDAEWQW